MPDIQRSLDRLRAYIEKEGFKGYDPYDTLNSPIPFSVFGKWGNILAIQFQKRNPVNIRPLLGIKKSFNAKSSALLLEAYVNLERQGRSKSKGVGLYETQIETLFCHLKDNQSKGFSGACWGYSFPWATSEKHLPAHAPNIVATSYAIRAIHNYYSLTGNEDARKLILSSAKFVMNDLIREENDAGAFFSYTPYRKDCVYNASLFAAEIIARAYALDPVANKDYSRLASLAVEFVITQQHEDGHWNYSLDLNSRKERIQIDFHQGYILDSIWYIADLLALKDEKWMSAMRKGAQYYRNVQFHDDGRGKWRIPKDYPVDIHNQSQGIITFTRLAFLDPTYSIFARRIADYTLRNMQSSDGHFHYRKYRFYSNRISYLRWSNAEMLVALSLLK